MARKFLYVIAGLIVLVLAGLLLLRIFAEDLSELAFVPTTQFTPQPAMQANAYDAMEMWIARPGMGATDPALWRPAGVAQDAKALGVAVFFVHPTSYLQKDAWNAPLDHAESRLWARRYVQGQASPFNTSADIWAPRYRQAAFGAFLTEAPEGQQALDAAYADVEQAFAKFIATVDPDAPIVLAGHSQGAFHLRRLIRDKVAGTPLAPRIAAAYLVGWPISIKHDLPKMDMPGCSAPDQAGCVMGWASFAEPADVAMVRKGYERHPGLDKLGLTGTDFLCTNPITGKTGLDAAPASANLGTLVPDFAKESGALVPAMASARCGKDGFLYIGDPPKMGNYVLPGNNYHVYDMVLFWANIRADFARRIMAWQAQQG